jgi:hypothetical protein
MKRLVRLAYSDDVKIDDFVFKYNEDTQEIEAYDDTDNCIATYSGMDLLFSDYLDFGEDISSKQWDEHGKDICDEILEIFQSEYYDMDDYNINDMAFC